MNTLSEAFARRSWDEAPPLGRRELLPRSLRPGRILIAEDEPTVRQSLARLFELDGYDVVAVATGTELLHEVSDWVLRPSARVPFDAIIADLRMPGLDPVTVVAGLEELGWPGLLVVMSAAFDERATQRLSALRHVELLQKPFNPTVLEERIRIVVG